jgi:hypothetical protein
MKRFIAENFWSSSIYHLTDHKMTLVTSDIYIYIYIYIYTYIYWFTTQTAADEEEKLVNPTNTKFSSGFLCWEKGNKEDSAFLSYDLEKVEIRHFLI